MESTTLFSVERTQLFGPAGETLADGEANGFELNSGGSESAAIDVIKGRSCRFRARSNIWILRVAPAHHGGGS